MISKSKDKTLKISFWIKAITSILFLSTLVVSLVLYGNKNGFFNIKKIDIVTLKQDRLTPYHQKQKIELEKKLLQIQGESLLDVKLSYLQELLQNELWIEESYLSREWPDQLKVEIIPQKISAILLNAQGGMFPLNSLGVKLSPIENVEMPNVLILRGESLEKKYEERKKAMELIMSIPEQGAFSRERISDINYDSQKGLWTQLLDNSLQVYLGKEDIALRANRVSQVVQYLENKKINGRVIDASYSKKVLVKLRKSP